MISARLLEKSFGLPPTCIWISYLGATAAGGAKVCQAGPDLILPLLGRDRKMDTNSHSRRWAPTDAWSGPWG